MGVARIRTAGKLKAVVTRDSAGTELARFEPGKAPVAAVPREPLPEPTLPDMADHLASSMLAWAAAGFAVAPSSVRALRLEQCETCEFWDGKARLTLGKCRHPSCGCTRAKLWLATERCPIGRWGSHPG